MFSHTFAICAYKDSPYLEDCIKSLKRQSVPADIILCTSTPSKYIRALADVYELPLFVRQGKSHIQDDWNFAYQKADTRLVTIAHQDDCYHRDYLKTVRQSWEEYPDITVFTSDCAILKDQEPQKPGAVQFVKHVLRIPLRFHSLSHIEWIKKLPLRFGNSIICPSCTYDKEALGEPLFNSPYEFALDWDTMWKLAEAPGRFFCVEKPLIRYRIHEEAATKACIQNHRRVEEETLMYEKMWPRPLVHILMFFYKKAYHAYD
ncbi:MAG: glycosyltransferase [Lachnospiraceae bacterium]